MIDELRRLRESEANRILSRNKKLVRGSLVLRRTDLESSKTPSVYKVAYTRPDMADVLVVKTKSQRNVTTICKDSIELLTPRLYEHILDKYYAPGSTLTDVNIIIKYLKTKIEEFFGEDYVDITREYNDSRRVDIIYITIRFPELTVRNSLGTTRKLYDTYLRCRLSRISDSKKNKWELHPTVYRTKFTRSEYEIKYILSHWNGCPGKWSSNVCFNSNPHLANYKRMDIQDVLLYILYLKEHMEWESLEGSTFKSIESIKDYTVSCVSPLCSNLSRENITRGDFIVGVLKNLENFTYEMGSDDIFTITNMPQIQDAIKKYYKSNGYEKYLGILTGRNTFGIPEKREPLPEYYINGTTLDNEYIIFKGKVVECKFIEDHEKEITNFTWDDLQVHTDDVSFIKSALEEELSSIIIPYLYDKYD